MMLNEHIYRDDQSIVFLSDVHLQSSQDSLAADLQRVLEGLSDQVDAVYILGDLFDFWIGSGCLDEHRIIFSFFRRLSSKCSIYFMPGNRDFFLTSSVCARNGICKIKDPTCIYHGNRAILLMHGDVLCRQDKRYLWMRAVLQSPLILGLAAVVPYRFVKWASGVIRQFCSKAKAAKALDLMQADSGAEQQWLDRYQADILIYGHVHSLSHRVFSDNCRQIVVMDAWEHQVNYCALSKAGIQIIAGKEQVTPHYSS